jgi:predicted NUDIX family phosphoesterase
LEFVYVVERHDLFDLAFPHGFVARDAGGAVYRERILEHGFFLEREAAERSSRWKQVIPYNLVTHGESVLLFRRGKRITESRLQERLSIGVGGHVNPEDAAGPGGRSGVLEAAAVRELHEEIEPDEGYAVETIGFVNDDSEPVGSVHFGVVNVVRLATPRALVRETENLRGGLVEWSDLLDRYRRRRGEFESWTSLLLDRILERGVPGVTTTLASRGVTA